MGKGCCPVCMHRPSPLEKASTPVTLLSEHHKLCFTLSTHTLRRGEGRIPQGSNSKYVALGKTNLPQYILHSSYFCGKSHTFLSLPPFWHPPTRYHHHWRQISASAAVFPNHHHLANYVFPSIFFSFFTFFEK